MYEPLSKLYYKNPAKYKTEYEKRLNSYGTVKLPFYIKPYKSNEEFSCFYVNHSELDMLHDQIMKQSCIIQSIVNELPPIAVQQYIQSKLVDELLSTNEIEGVYSTRAEMETVIEIVVRPDISTKRNVRHLSLMKSYFSLFSETNALIQNVEHIRKIYDHLLQEEITEKDALDGKLFRKQPVDVVTSTNKIVHRGVYPEQAIETHLKTLIDYLNEHNSPMLYRIAVSHYYFGYIHPFYDGNGRTSRYISSMYLLNELDRLTALTLSYSTNKAKQLYYDAFTESNHPHNKGELTFFCEAFFQIIHKAQHDILADLSEKKEKMMQLAKLITELPTEDELSQNILFLLGQHSIFGIEGKGMTKQELMTITEKTEYVIRKALDELTEKGIIELLKKRPIEVTFSKMLKDQLEGV